jgi:SAM-dependent methyltransferase
MGRKCRVPLGLVLGVLACASLMPLQIVVYGSGQTPPGTPALQAPSAQELELYEAFRAWINVQPPEVRQEQDAAIWASYARVLQAQGRSAQQAAQTIEQLKKIGDRAEFERWNRILTAEKPSFNTAPNAFLVEMTKGLKPGRSLDVGMGQGRNTIYLAQQGWDSAGFDPANRAVAAAQERATALGVKITTTVTTDDAFDWGDSQWDLIVFSYVGARDYVDKVTRALRPSGMVVIEGFHRDATRSGPIGGAVVFDTNELVRLFPALRIVRYEDAPATADFGLLSTRVVRLAAIKP